MRYVAKIDQPGNVVTDVFAIADGGPYFAMEGRIQGNNSATRTSQQFGSLFDLIKALRSQNDTDLDWSPFT